MYLFRFLSKGFLATVFLLALGCQNQAPVASTPQPTANLYEGFGNYHRPITTGSPSAQRWFDQGMQLVYGFNHDEGIRSFKVAAEQDAAAPMPWWNGWRSMALPATGSQARGMAKPTLSTTAPTACIAANRNIK